MRKRLKPILLAAFVSRELADRAIEDLVIAGFAGHSIGLISPLQLQGRMVGTGWTLPEGRETSPIGSIHFDIAELGPTGPVNKEGPGAVSLPGNVIQIPDLGSFSACGFFSGATSDKQWLASCLAGTDLTGPERGQFELQIEAGKTLIGVLPEGRVILAGEILRRYGGELTHERSHSARW